MCTGFSILMLAHTQTNRSVSVYSAEFISYLNKYCRNYPYSINGFVFVCLSDINKFWCLYLYVDYNVTICVCVRVFTDVGIGMVLSIRLIQNRFHCLN